MRRMLGSAAVVCAVALGVGIHLSQAGSFNPDPLFPVGPISDTTSHQIAKLDQVASKLAGQKAVVNCWSLKGWAQLQAWQSTHHDYAAVDAYGITWKTTRHIELAPFVCESLGQVLAKSADQPLFTAVAVHVLAHESAHASGISAENEAECTGLKTGPEAGELLGFSPSVAVRLQHIFRGTMYPYDAPTYRTPACEAGLPGVVVPDTLGTKAELRPFESAAAAAAKAVPHWTNIGGAYSVGPLSPCSPAVSRANEQIRIGEAFTGGLGESLILSGGRLRTKADFKIALTRFKALDRCDLLALRKLDREDHTPGTITFGRVPASISHLSSRVLAYRDIWTESGEKWNRDTIFVLDEAQRSWMHLFFRAPVGELPTSVEIRTTKAILQKSS